jgi:cellulose synthase/poly-beta-1,6-N-acetylglucosamine synthase-like glycosyltransferase
VSPAAALFWGAFALLLYVYLGYPAIAWLRRCVSPRPISRSPLEPYVSVVVVAHNEAHRIGRRIENLLSADYPHQRLSIIIGSDGSTDETVECARRYRNRGVVVREFGQRRGKAAVLNDLVACATGDIVVFADARQRFEEGAVRELVAGFADAEVGAVSGELHLRKRNGTSPGGEGAGFYWRYEKFIRANESWSGSTVGATGAIYAIRRHLFEPIPHDTILDDVLIPVTIVRKGYRVVFEACARAHDLISTSPSEDFIRKARTIAGTFQLFARQPWILNPWRSRVWFRAFSHKALRLTIPLLHVLLFAANLVLAPPAVARGSLGEIERLDALFYGLFFAGQLMFYAAAVAGYFQVRSPRRSVFFTVPYTMCLLGWATVVGLGRFVARRQRVTWERMPGDPGPRVVSRPV